MSLVDLKTDLKSLKFGNDRPGGGDSKQPYYTVNINDIDKGINKFRLTKFDDGLIRGGVVGAANASVIDTMRIGKFLFTDVKGPLFIVKQVGLQLSNPRLEVPKNNRNITQGGLDNISSASTNGLLQPTRIYNLGINTLAQVPISAIGGHITRHGILPVQNEASKYEAVVIANNENHNRLSALTKKFELGDKKLNFNPISRITNRVNNLLGLANSISTIFGGPKIPSINQNPENLIIDQYIGGPSSVYGIGQTIIRRSANTENGDEINRALDRSKQRSGRSLDKNGQDIDLNYYNTLGVSKQYFNDNGIETYDGIKSNLPNYKPSNLDVATYSNIFVDPIEGKSLSDNTVEFTLSVEVHAVPIKKASYNSYKKIIDSKQLREFTYKIDGSTANTFGIYGNNNQNKIVGDSAKTINPDSLSTPIYYNSQTNKVVSIKLPWNEVYREKRIGSGLQDSINLTPIFSSTSYANYNKVTLSNGKEYNVRDLAKFVIQSVNTDAPQLSDFMVFRAYITNLSDNVDAQWTDIKYAGRGNPFYVYNGFTRKVQVGFKVAALSAEEMEPMYSKLNYLMSSLMPDYGDKNVMRGSLHRLTVGNYFDSQLGILNSISYTVPNDSPWEIAIDEPEGGTKMLILPHIIEVTMNFTPIGAETGAIDDKGNNVSSNKIEEKTAKTSFLAQNTTGGDVATVQYFNNFTYGRILKARDVANYEPITPVSPTPVPISSNVPTTLNLPTR